MKQYFGKPKTNIIFAADLVNLNENAKVIEQICTQIDVIKIGTPLILEEGISVIEKLNNLFNIPIFVDLKVADVPHTCVKIVKQVADHGGAAIMVHGIIGPDGIVDCMSAANNNIGIIIQSELTNPGGKLFTAPISNDIATLAAALGVFGIQAPGNRPERIREIRKIVGDKLTMVSCGVGKQGGSHKSVMQSGGDYSIIGRAIYESSEPSQALIELI